MPFGMRGAVGCIQWPQWVSVFQWFQGKGRGVSICLGGMSEVYKGFHHELRRHVAIKVMGRSLQSDPTLTERFRREAQAAASLRHSNIITPDLPLDPPGPDRGSKRVIRGGGYRSNEGEVRTTYRREAKPQDGKEDLGFRCAVSGGWLPLP